MARHPFKFLFRRRQLDRDLEDEIRAHLEIEKQQRVERGETPGMAEQNARRALGNELLIKEVTREMWGWISIERIFRDLLYALRQSKRSPGFAAVAILSLALGIGANSAIFSILNALLFKSLPVAAPNQLFLLREQFAPSCRNAFRIPCSSASAIRAPARKK